MQSQGSTRKFWKQTKKPRPHASTLHVCYNDIVSPLRMTIIGSDTITSLYVVNWKNFSPIIRRTHVTISRASSPYFPTRAGALVASASLHKWGHRIDLRIGSSTGSLRPTAFLSHSLRFVSSIGPLTWHRVGPKFPSPFYLKLVDGEENLVARFRTNFFSSTRTVVGRDCNHRSCSGGEATEVPKGSGHGDRVNRTISSQCYEYRGDECWCGMLTPASLWRLKEWAWTKLILPVIHSLYHQLSSVRTPKNPIIRHRFRRVCDESH